MGDDEDRSFHFNKRPDKTYVSKSIPTRPPGEKLRIASKVIDNEEGLKYAIVENEIVVRTTPKGRSEIKATFLEDNRKLKVLTIQKFNSASGPVDKQYFSFVHDEIDTLLNFIVGIKTMVFSDERKHHLTDEQLRDLILNDGQARRVFAENEELFVKIAQSENLRHDLVALGYRRNQLDRFEHLLKDKAFFEAEKARLGKTPEAVWQQFFEANTWIFGYGLSYQFLTGLDGRKLEQVVLGHDLGGAGKRADALMKTQARINSLCFVEIKRHDTPLLASSLYRADAWPPSSDLAGGVAQLQATVQGALEDLGRKITTQNSIGDPTGETLFNIEPRSFLVIGNLEEFIAEHGINESKFRSFEMYRRHTRRPEILTFDELLHRARFIVEHSNVAADAR
jgi:hypothetical protein